MWLVGTELPLDDSPGVGIRESALESGDRLRVLEVTKMDFVLTEEFSQAYDQLSDAEAIQLDPTIRRLLDEHGSAWARQGRIEADEGGGRFDGEWIATAPVDDELFHIYWEYEAPETLALIALARVQ